MGSAWLSCVSTASGPAWIPASPWPTTGPGWRARPRTPGRRLLAEASRAPAVAGGFARLLASRGMVDFDGLISLTLALLREAPDLAAAPRVRWCSISVDEYQDTDADQYALLRLLAGDGS